MHETRSAKPGHLLSQSGAFWIGAFMVAEAPVTLALWLIGPERREGLFAALCEQPTLWLCAVAGVLAAGAATGWVALRLGLGDATPATRGPRRDD